jgi:hypothetical protein
MKWKEPDVIEKYEQKQVGRRDKTPMIDKLAGQLEDAQKRITDLEGKLAECEQELKQERETADECENCDGTTDASSEEYGFATVAFCLKCWNDLASRHFALKQKLAAAREAALLEAANLAIQPYSDEVEAYGNDEPSMVGKKIAVAIRRLAALTEADELKEEQ